MQNIPILALAALVAIAGSASAFHFGPHALYTYNDQATGARSVVVENVYLPYGGFIALHDGTLLEGNVLGSVVGVSDFLPTTTATIGNHSSVRITLHKAITGPTSTLIVMPHNDTNGNRIYDFISSGGTADGPYTGGAQALTGLTGDLAAFNGIVATPRTLNVSASIRAVDQPTKGTSMLVDYVELSEDGFVAVHDATLLTASGTVNDVFGSVVGVSARLAPGIHRNVLVPFTFNASKTNVTGLVIPMVHKDTNDNAAYDFVSSAGQQDGPFVGQFNTPLTTVVATPTLTWTNTADTTYVGKSTGGRLVVVEQAFLPEGGFIAVHDSTLVSAADALGSVRGVSLKLAPGLHRSIPVELTFGGKAALNASQTIYVMPHKDSDSDATYDFVSSGGTIDPPYTGGPDALSGLTGNLAGFNTVSTAAGNATIGAIVWSAPDQDSNGRTITVAYADLSEPGFVAVHDESLLANPSANVLSSVIGTSARLQAGLSKDVVVTFSNVAGASKGVMNISQTLVLMPHKDSNGNGAYDFVSSQGQQDPPFTTSAPEGNTVNALNLNIVFGIARATVPPVLPPTIKIASPIANAQSSSFSVSVDVANFDLKAVGTTPGKVAGQGHIHYLVDGAPAPGDYATTSKTFTITGLSAGEHTITAELTNNDHSSLSPRVFQDVKVRAVAPPTPTPSPAPTLTIVSPTAGASGSSFSVRVDVADHEFAPVGTAANKAGQGHIHYLVDGKPAPGDYATTSKTFTVSGLSAGEHTITVELVNNDHSSLSPKVSREVKVNVAAAATPTPTASASPITTPPSSSPEAPTPGFTVVALIGAIAIAITVMRKRG